MKHLAIRIAQIQFGLNVLLGFWVEFGATCLSYGDVVPVTKVVVIL